MFERVQGARAPAQPIQWLKDDATALDLSGATLTGFIWRAGVATPITGALTLLDPPAGIFRWDYSADDVAVAGYHAVEFVATWSVGLSPAITKRMEWTVAPRLAAG